MITRRSFLTSAAGLGTLGALGALTACGGASEPAASSATTSGSTGAGWPRTVEHEHGETVLEARPERVVAGTDGAELCALLALGVTPVGYGRRWEDQPPPWLAGKVEDLEEYDLTSGETSYERLAAWAPDLVVVQTGFATPETMPRFNEVAPTVATSFIDWRASLRQVGAAVGLDAEAAVLEERTDAAVADVAARLTADLGGRTEGFRLRGVCSFTDGSVYSFNADSPLGRTAAALGLAPLPPSRTPGEALDQISLEQLDLVDGDLVLVMHFDDAPDGYPQLAARSVWTQLEAVRAGRVVELGPDESNQLYFDAVTTVEPNAAVVDRLVRSVLA